MMERIAATDWWIAWPILWLIAYVVYRVRKRGGDEPLARRIEYTLLPHTDPANSQRRESTRRQVMIVLVGLAVIGLLNLIVAVAER